MAVSVRFGVDLVATVSNGKWGASEKVLADILNIVGVADIENYTPWPDYTLAEMAVEALGGRIIKATDRPDFVAGRIY